MEGEGREPITAKGSALEELAALGEASLWLSPLQNHTAPGLALTGCAEAPGIQRPAWVNRTSKIQGHLSFLLLLVPAALPQWSIHEPLVGNSLISPQGFSPARAHPGGSKQSTAPHHLLQLFLLQPRLLCTDARKELHKVAQKQAPPVISSCSKTLFETLHQDLPALLFFCPCLHLGG